MLYDLFREFLSGFIHTSFSYSGVLQEFYFCNSGYFILEKNKIEYYNTRVERKIEFDVKRVKSIYKSRVIVKIPEELKYP